MTSQATIINISHSELVDEAIVTQHYDSDALQKVLMTTLTFMLKKQQSDVEFPYFEEMETEIWRTKPVELDIYITDMSEAKQLNKEARGKDYATNILSYPSELPPFVLNEMPTLPLGELIICHDVVVTQAKEQKKTIDAHALHLIVHGILHLLGFDHELGDAEADEMEGFEIEIMKELGFGNPYDD